MENKEEKCKNCGKNLVFPEKAFISLENYNVGGSVIVASECCNKGYVIEMEISYNITEYEGKAQEDDWGEELSK